MRKRTLLLVLPTVAIVGACGSPDTAARSEASTTTSTTTSATAAGNVALRIDTIPGFVAPDAAFADVAELTVLDDGTVLTMGAQTQEYPGPALPPVISGTLTAAEVNELVTAARDAGVRDPSPDFGQPAIADAPTTTFTVRTDGRDVTVSVNALAETKAGSGNGLTPAQVAARQKINGFHNHAFDVATRKATQRYTPIAFAVLARDVSGTTDTVDPKPADITWPGEPIATRHTAEKFGAACFDVTGDEFTTVYPAVRQARANAHWHSNNKTYALTFKVVLPGGPSRSCDA